MEEVYQDGAWTDENMREEGGVDFTEISREEPVLFTN